MQTSNSRGATEPKQQRLSKEDWLAKSLELLAAEGASHMRIDRIAAALGVTKGSFYHHFADRADFVRLLVRYWDENYSRVVDLDRSFRGKTPEDRLWQLMLVIVEKDLARYDVPIRAWATRDPIVREQVRANDQFRHAYLRNLFAEMGFSGEELEMRSRTFVSTTASEAAIYDQVSPAKRKKLLRAQHAFFVRQ